MTRSSQRKPVFFTPEVYREIEAIRTESPIVVVSWLGTVTELPNGAYLVDKIFVPKQDCNAGASEISSEAMMEEIQRERNPDDALARIRYWGLCYPEGGVHEHSDTNEQMMHTLLGTVEAGPACFMLGLYNQSGDTSVSLWSLEDGAVSHENTAWAVWDPIMDEVLNSTDHAKQLTVTEEDRERVRALLSEKLNVFQFDVEK